MAALGEKLRREREARGVSLREIAEATRIHEKYLRALEENDYGTLPGSVFVTGFLRNYAVHLGLDADKIVIEFEAMKIEPPVDRSLVMEVVDDGERSVSTFRVVGALLLLLVVYVAYVNWPSGAPERSGEATGVAVEKPATPATDKIEKQEIISDADNTEPLPPNSETVAGAPVTEQPVAASPVTEQPVTEQPLAKPPVAEPPVAEPEVKKKPPVQAVAKKKPAPAVAKKKPAPAAALVQPKKKKKALQKKAAVAPPNKKHKYKLVVAAQDEDAWILVVVDDTIERDMFVRAGQVIVINGNDSFNFTTGNAREIKLTLNGEPLKFDVPPGNVIRSWNIPLPGAE